MVLPIFIQANIIVERIVASMIDAGVLSSLEYARTVTETGLVLITVPLGLASLSELGNLSQDQMRARMLVILRGLALLFIPTSAFLAVHAEHVISVLFARGAFDGDAQSVTTQILATLAYGFW